MPTVSYQSCEIFVEGGRLYLCPHRMPPKEFPADIDTEPLGEEVITALDETLKSGRSNRAGTWRILADFLGKAPSALGRKKLVRIRRTMEEGELEIWILGPNDDKHQLFKQNPYTIGSLIRGLLQLPAPRSSKEQRMEHQFCGVFVLNKNLHVVREEKVGGPRQMRWPLRELPMNIDAESLGKETLAALADYRIDGRPMSRDEGEAFNQRLLDFFGERSIGAFERKKNEVTVRRDVASGAITLFPERGEDVLDLDSSEDPTRLGSSIRKHLALPDSDAETEDS